MSEIVLTPSKSGSTVNAQPGDVVIVQLPENGTTGYVWAIDSVDADMLALEDSQYAASGGAGVGGGGVRTFRFKVQRPGVTRLALKQWREWQGDSSIVERFEATVQAN